jgi:hypothetical protein
VSQKKHISLLSKSLASILLATLLVVALGPTATATTITTAGSGNWNSTTPNAPWPGGTVPLVTDNVIIAAGNTVTVTAAASITNLTLNATTSKLIINSGQTITVSGTFSNSGTTTNGVNGPGVILFTGTASIGVFTPTGTVPDVTIGDGTSTNTVTITANTLVSDVIVNANATLTNTTFTVGISGSLSVNGTLNAGTGVYTLSGAAQTISGTVTVPSLAVTGTYTNNNSLTVGTALSGAGGLTQAVSATLFVGGTATITTLTATAAGNTVNYNGGAAQPTCKPTTYLNLTLSGAGAKTFATTPTVNGVLSLEGTASIVATVGVVTYGANATLRYNKPGAYTATAEEWITPFAATGGVVIANAGAITMNVAKVFNASVPLTINNGATLVTNNRQLTFGGDFVNSGGTFTAGSSPIVIANTMVAQSIVGFTTTGSVSMTKASGTATISGNVSAANLTVSAAGTLVLGGSNTFSGTRTITAGTLVLANTSALGVAGTAIALNGGTLDLMTNASVNAYNVTVGGAAAISSDRATSGAGITHALGTLSIGNFQLNVTVGTNVSGGTAGLTFGSTTFSASTPIFDVPTGANLTLGALTGNFNFGKQNNGQITLNTASARAGGSSTLTAGTMVLGNASALGTVATSLVLNGGTLDLMTDASVNAYNTTVGGTATISSDRATGGVGITHTLGTLSIGNFQLNITVGTNVSGGTAGMTFGTTTFSASTPIFDVAASANLTLGALTGNFNFTKQNGGQITLNTASARSAGSSTLTAGSMVLGSASALGTTATTLILNGGTLDLAVSSTVNAYPTTVGGNAIILSNTATAVPGITHALGTLSIGANTLTINKGANATGVTAAVSFGNLTMTGAPTFTPGTANLLMTGSSSGNFKLTKSGASTLQKTTAGWSLAFDFEVTAGIYDANGQTTTVAGLTTISGGEYQAKTALQTFNGGLTVSGGTFTGAAGNVSTTDVLLSSGTLTAPSGTLSLSGSWTNTGATFTPGTGTVTFTGNSASITGSSVTQTFNNIVVNKTAGQLLSVGGSTTALTLNAAFTETTGDFTAPATMIVTGAMTLTAGTFTAGANVSVGGNWTNNGGTFTPGTGMVTFNGGAAQALNGSAATQTFFNFTVNKGGGTLTVGGSTTTLTLGGALTLTAGTFAAGTATTVNLAGDWANNSAAAAFAAGTSNVNLNGSIAQVIGGTFATTFRSLTLSNSAGASLGNIITVSANLAISNGTLSDNGSQITGNAGGTLTMAASTGLILGSVGTGTSFPTNFATFALNASSTVTYASGAPQTVSGVPTYENLAFSGGGTKTISSVTTANGGFTITSPAVVSVGAITLTIKGSIMNGGSLINNGTISVGP